MSWRTVPKVVGSFTPGIIDIAELSDSASSAGEDEALSFDELDITNSPTTKTRSLERTLDRAESILQQQLTVLTDTHDRAVRTVRVEVVLLGAIASVWQITPNPVSVNLWLGLSGVLLIGSITLGIFTSSSSSPDFGPGPSYVRANIESGDPNDDVYLRLLQGYSEAISYNNDVLNDSATYLFVSQSLLMGCVVLGSVGFLVAL